MDTNQQDAPASPRQRTPFQQRRPAPVDCGCHCYELRGVAYTRCPEHRPAGSTGAGPVRGACPECKPL